MANLRRKVEDLGQPFYYPIHRDEPLVCSRYDVLKLPDEKWEEFRLLMEQAGYLTRPSIQSVGPCWQCGEGHLCCLECTHKRQTWPRDSLPIWGVKQARAVRTHSKGYHGGLSRDAASHV